MSEAAAQDASQVQAAEPRETDYLLPSELRQPHTHVQASDLAGVVRLRDWSRAELWQRKKDAQLLPASVALLLLLRTVHGLKGGPLGCGAQVTVEEFAEHIGFAETHMHNAFRQTEAEGLIVRIQQELPVATLTKDRKGGPADVLVRWHKKGRERRQHGKADAVAVTYLTPKGCRLVDSMGTTRAVLRVPTTAGRLERQTVATGLLWRLWKTLRRSLAAARCRVTAVRKKCTPYAARIKKKEVSSTTSCSSSAGLWETPTAAGSGAAQEGRAPSQPDSETHGPPRGAGTQAHAPPGRAARAGDCTAPHTSRPGGGEVACPPVPENLVAGLPATQQATFWECWRHTRTEARYRQPNPHYSGERGLLEDGTLTVWAPRMTAATAAPNRWRNSSAWERHGMVRKFEPVRLALTEALREHERQKAAAAEAAAAAAAQEAARAAAERQRMLDEVEALERRRRQQPGAGAW